MDRRSDPQHRENGPAFELFAAKLRRPVLRPGTVRRWLLIDRLAHGDPRPIVSVVSPPGYGKTTLLSLLPTYLPLGEIAAELFLSPHTVKTQTSSIYRKLGASTRSQAVTRARQLGLLDG